MLVYCLKANHPYITKNQFSSLTVVEDSTKTTRILWTNVCVPVSMILALVLNELVVPKVAFGGAVKMTCSQAKSPKVFE